MVEFIESMGRYFEQYGISRIGGRILGLLAIAERSLSLDDIATQLQVSRASVSTNLRLATASDLADLVTFPGDRRDYYRMVEDAWSHGMRAELKAYPPLRRIAERALSALDEGDSPAREQLEEMIDFCDFALEEWNGLLERWQARRAARQRMADAAVNVGATGATSEVN
jgi:DNA-binding transcriptional regulator GbsR (MarR family)